MNKLDIDYHNLLRGILDTRVEKKIINYNSSSIKHKLTIVIPCKNEVNYIESTLDSINEQIGIEGDAYVGKRDQLAKFKKLENKLIEKYTYSRFSKLLWDNR